QDLDACKYQKCTKQIDHPMECLDHRDSGEDQRRTKHQRSEHTPEQDSILELGRDGEVGEDQHEHEDVIDAEAFLDQISCEELIAGGFAEENEYAYGEDQRDSDIAKAYEQGLAYPDDSVLSMQNPQVQR